MLVNTNREFKLKRQAFRSPCNLSTKFEAQADTGIRQGVENYFTLGCNGINKTLLLKRLVGMHNKNSELKDYRNYINTAFSVSILALLHAGICLLLQIERSIF